MSELGFSVSEDLADHIANDARIGQRISAEAIVQVHHISRHQRGIVPAERAIAGSIAEIGHLGPGRRCCRSSNRRG